MNEKLKIKIILGSTRQGRFGDKPAGWIFDGLKNKEGIDPEILDLRDYPMPFFDELVSPSMAKDDYANESVKKWSKKIGEADGYIIVTPEYNHGYPAVLKNALDYVYYQWNNKPVAFVSYGSVAGARSVEQLREVIVELHMVSTRESVYIPFSIYLEVVKDKTQINLKPLEALNESREKMFNELVWWGTALKKARDENKK